MQRILLFSQKLVLCCALLVGLGHSTLAQTLVAGEYFMGADPGYGQGTALSFTVADDSLTLSENLSIPALPPGLHPLSVRFLDSAGQWSFTETMLLRVQDQSIPEPPPTLVSGEYFWDADPGKGQGTPVTISISGDSASVAGSVTVPDLPPGLHTLNFRCTDARGQWSHTASQILSFADNSTPPLPVPMASGEYFWDQDPGAGQATPIAVSVSGDSATAAESVTVPNLAAGLHSFNLRFVDQAGQWSQIQTQIIQIQDTDTTTYTPSPLVAGEYFFDVDPGQGLGIPVSATISGDSLTLIDSLPLDTLGPGIHALGMRFRQADGTWSHARYQTVVVEEPPVVIPIAPLVAGEYFFDTDPGLGQGTVLMVPRGDSVDLSEQIVVPDLGVGVHTLSVRFQDSTGRWGHHQSVRFQIEPDTVLPFSPALLVGGEYFFGPDPGLGQGAPLSFNAGDSVHLTEQVSIPDLAAGTHTLSVRLVDENGIWSHTQTQRITVAAPTDELPAKPHLVAAEYFLDVDPGQGLGHPLAMSATDTAIHLNEVVDLSGVAVGTHVVGLRFLDDQGDWSQAAYRRFEVSDTTVVAKPAPSPLVAAEYFLDSLDPGLGQASELPMSPEGPDMQYLGEVMQNLDTGWHTLTVRFRDARGLWSHNQSESFHVDYYGRHGDSLHLARPIYYFPYTDTDTLSAFTNSYTGPSNQPSPDVLYQLVLPECADSVRISLCNSDFDTYLHVLDQAGNELLHSNDSCGQQSLLMTNMLTPLDTFYIVVEGNNSALGVYELQVDYTPYTLPRLGDPVICGTQGDSLLLTMPVPEATISWSTGDTGDSLWVYDNALVHAEVSRYGCVLRSDTVLVYMNATPGTLSGPGQRYVGQSASFTYTGTYGSVSWERATNGGTWIPVGGGSSYTHVQDTAGTTYLRVRHVLGECDTALVTTSVTYIEKPGDRIETALAMGGLPYAVTDTTGLYTNQYGSQPSADVFYAFTVPTCTDSVVISLCNSAFNTYLHVLDSAGNEVLSNDDFCGTASLIGTRALESGATYYAVVEGNGSQEGIFTLHVQAIPLAIEFAERNVLCPGDSVRLGTDIAGASYAWNTGDTTAWLSVSAEGQYQLEVSKGACRVVDSTLVDVLSTGTLSALATALQGAMVNLTVSEENTVVPDRTWEYARDSTTWLRLSQQDAASYATRFDAVGTYGLRVTEQYPGCDLFVSNVAYLTIGARQGDRFDHPIVVNAFPFSHTDTSSLYTNQFDTVGGQASREVFYQFTAPACYDQLTISLCDANFNTYLHVLDSAGRVVARNDNHPSCGYRSKLALWDLVPGATYYAVVEGLASSQGQYTLRMDYTALELSAGVDQLICPGDSALLQAPHYSGASYLWSTGDTLSSLYTHHGGTYWVQLNKLDCTLTDSVSVTINAVPAPGTVQNPVPVDGSENLSKPVIFSWQPASDAAYYDLYVWPDATPRPATPAVAGLTEINFPYSGLTYGEAYQWQVIAGNACATSAGPVQGFSVQGKPDLQVANLSHSTALSGQVVEISWTVTNHGDGLTPRGDWLDRVWLSPDIDVRIGESEDVMLGEFKALRALDAGESYTQTVQVSLPQSLVGPFYLFVISDNIDAVRIDPDTKVYGGDHGGSIIVESQENNNLDYMLMEITTAPPPDLKVTDITLPVNPPFSGQAISISYSVLNDGTSATAPTIWTDQIYLSDTTNMANAVPLKSVTHTGRLQPDSSYQVTTSVTLPNGIFGDYYLAVETDAGDEVIEGIYDGNNITYSNPLSVILRPNLDLTVSQLFVDDTASVGGTLDVIYTVANQGASDPAIVGWVDQLGIATSSTGDEVQWLHTQSHTGTLAANDFYTHTIRLPLPEGLAGTYYVYARTDANNVVYEYNGEDNNQRRSFGPLAIVAPDVVTTELTALDSASSGAPLLLHWTVQNQGRGATTTSRVDALLLSSTPSLDSGEVYELGITTDAEHLKPGASRDYQKTVALPEGISGTHYLSVKLDANNQVYEAGGELNNLGDPRPIEISLSDWADLVPQPLVVTDTLQAGVAAPMHLRTINGGRAGTADAVWTDHLYLSRDTLINLEEDMPLASHVQGGDLAADSSYSWEISPYLSPNLPEGNYYLYVMTDVADVLYEHTGEENNHYWKSVYVKGFPPVDLAATAFTYADSARSGQAITVSWSVTNQSATDVPVNVWHDGLYLSTDTLLDGTDRLLRSVDRYSPFAADSAYRASVSVKVPNGISGSYYLLAVADYKQELNDANRSNNVTVGPALSVSLTPWADLVPSGFTVQEEGIAGQPLAINWSVSNVGPATTQRSQWYDHVYLSTDFVLDEEDKLLGKLLHQDTLAPQASYDGAGEIVLPLAANGNYILILKADGEDQEYEHQSEDNNLATVPISVVQLPPADLIVKRVLVEPTATTGAKTLVRWQIENMGDHPARGYMKDLLYLSEDAQYDETDVLLGAYGSNIQVLPGTAAERMAEFVVPGMAEGEYFVLVQTDAANNINEVVKTNNLGSSADKLSLAVPELVIHQTQPDSLTNGDPLYYQIKVPANLVGETLLVTLKGDSLNGHNELYLRKDAIPSRTAHDLKYSNLLYGNQEILIPTLEEGSYYLLAYGKSLNANVQGITLRAEILNFDIRYVDANTGGNTGNVTLRIRGSKFEPGMRLTLVDSTLGTVVAHKISYRDNGLLFGTFNLKDRPTGVYDVVLTKQSGEVARMEEAFTIEKGRVPSILLNVEHPPSVRVGRIVPMTVEFVNDSNVDIPAVDRLLLSHDGAAIGLTQDDLKFGWSGLEVTLIEADGPLDVLRPGGYGKIIIYTKVKRVPTLRFWLVE